MNSVSVADARGYRGCFKEIFTIVNQMLLCGERYEKNLHLKAKKLSIVQDVECWIACKHSNINIFVTLATK
jgi:hypothetical protein